MKTENNAKAQFAGYFYSDAASKECSSNKKNATLFLCSLNREISMRHNFLFQSLFATVNSLRANYRVCYPRRILDHLLLLLKFIFIQLFFSYLFFAFHLSSTHVFQINSSFVPAFGNSAGCFVPSEIIETFYWQQLGLFLFIIIFMQCQNFATYLKMQLDLHQCPYKHYLAVHIAIYILLQSSILSYFRY